MPAGWSDAGIVGILGPMLTALDHVILAVRDLDAASAAYQVLLGLAPSWRGRHPEAGTANVLFRLDNTYLELLSPAGQGPLAGLLGGWLDARGDGLLGLAFATDDIESCVAALSARGLEPSPIQSDYGRDSTTGAERRWRRAMLPLDRTRGVLLFPIRHLSPADALPPASPVAEPEAAAYALDHAVVQTTDGDAAKALYGDQLGLRLAVDKEFPDWGVRLMFFRVGGVTVEVAAALAGADTKAVLPGGNAAAGEDRLYGMTYRVRDIEAAQGRLAAAGVQVSEVRKGRRSGTRVFTVRDGTCGVPTLMIELN